MNLLRRWLTRPSRVPRGLRAALAVAMASLAAIGLAAPTGGATTTTPKLSAPLPPAQNGPDKPAFGPGPGNPVKHFPSSAALVAQGHTLYDESCSSCHGLNLRGTSGRAPALIGVGPGPVDFYLSTGRMPLADPYQQPDRARPAFDRSQIDAIIAYVSSFGGPPAPTANPSKGDVETGYHQFTLNCAGCHQAVARGGMFIGAYVPDLLQATAQEVAEAVRMGPYLMPHFDYRQISQYQLDSIARYVLYSQHPPDLGGWGIYNIGPIPEGIVAWLLALAALVIVARLIGERTDEGLPKTPRVPK